MKRCLVILLLFSSSAFALNYELGISYAMKKNSFDKDNYFETESSTASLSLYFSEMIALEMSYTHAEANRYEKPPGGNEVQTFQKTEVLGADLIFVFTPRKSPIQPYVKGGAAQLKRRQVTYDASNIPTELDIDPAVIPSYGAGIKFSITQTLSFRVSYDVWRTPVGNSTTDDSQLRAGLSWML